jgi:hypothetical protein
MVNRFVTIHRGYAAFIQLPAIHDFRLYLYTGPADTTTRDPGFDFL